MKRQVTRGQRIQTPYGEGAVVDVVRCVNGAEQTAELVYRVHVFESNMLLGFEPRELSAVNPKVFFPQHTGEVGGRRR